MQKPRTLSWGESAEGSSSYGERTTQLLCDGSLVTGDERPQSQGGETPRTQTADDHAVHTVEHESAESDGRAVEHSEYHIHDGSPGIPHDGTYR